MGTEGVGPVTSTTETATEEDTTETTTETTTAIIAGARIVAGTTGTTTATGLIGEVVRIEAAETEIDAGEEESESQHSTPQSRKGKAHPSSIRIATMSAWIPDRRNLQ